MRHSIARGTLRGQKRSCLRLYKDARYSRGIERNSDVLEVGYSDDILLSDEKVRAQAIPFWPLCRQWLTPTKVQFQQPRA